MHTHQGGRRKRRRARIILSVLAAGAIPLTALTQITPASAGTVVGNRATAASVPDWHRYVETPKSSRLLATVFGRLLRSPRSTSSKSSP